MYSFTFNRSLKTKTNRKKKTFNQHQRLFTGSVTVVRTNEETGWSTTGTRSTVDQTTKNPAYFTNITKGLQPLWTRAGSDPFTEIRETLVRTK